MHIQITDDDIRYLNVHFLCRQVLSVSLNSHLFNMFLPPNLRAFSQASQLQNSAGQPSEAAVPRYWIFIGYFLLSELRKVNYYRLSTVIDFGKRANHLLK